MKRICDSLPEFEKSVASLRKLLPEGVWIENIISSKQFEQLRVSDNELLCTGFFGSVQQLAAAQGDRELFLMGLDDNVFAYYPNALRFPLAYLRCDDTESEYFEILSRFDDASGGIGFAYDFDRLAMWGDSYRWVWLFDRTNEVMCLCLNELS